MLRHPRGVTPLVVEQQHEPAGVGCGEGRAPVEHVGRVQHERPGRPAHPLLGVGQHPGGQVAEAERDPRRVLGRHHGGGPVGLVDVAQVDVGVELAAEAVGPGYHQHVVAVVAVEVLVVVDVVGVVLGPHLSLVEAHVVGGQDAAGGVGQVVMDSEPVEGPGGERQVVEPGERGLGERGVGRRVGEERLGPGVDAPQRLPGLGQLVAGQEAGHDREPLAMELLDVVVGYPHGDVYSSGLPFTRTGRDQTPRSHPTASGTTANRTRGSRCPAAGRVPPRGASARGCRRPPPSAAPGRPAP